MSATYGAQSLERVISARAEKLERNLHTAQPGIVVSYDPVGQVADVQPAVRLAVPSSEDEDLDVYEDLPVIQHVPVAWPRGRGFSFVGSLSKGDPVLLVFAERDFSDWYESGQQSNPVYGELHALNNAIAIPGVAPRNNPIPVPSDAAALASKLDQFLRAVSVLPVPAPGADPASVTATFNAIIAAARAVTGSTGPLDPGLHTTGSNVVKLER